MAKKKNPAPEMTHLAALVFAETSFYTGAGVQSVMNCRDWFLNKAAREFWLGKHAESIPIALSRRTANWEQDRKLVTPRARDLGIYAAQYALADAAATGVVEITEEHVKKASAKVSKDKRCHAAAKKGPGRGGYCEG